MSERGERDAQAMTALGYHTGNDDGGTVVIVGGVLEAVASVSIDFGDPPVPVSLAGRHGHQLGTTVADDSAIARARPALFRPLVIRVDFPA